MSELDPAVIPLLKRAAARGIDGEAGLNGEECAALLSLLIEADSFISHMRHRGTWQATFPRLMR